MAEASLNAPKLAEAIREHMGLRHDQAVAVTEVLRDFLENPGPLVPFNTLHLAKALRDEAGLPQRQADGITRALTDIVVSQLASKEDLETAKAELRAEMRRAGR